MGILDRFTTIVKANINSLLDQAEDPAKMVDQYLSDMLESLAEVKKETAGVMAEETRTRARVEENAAEAEKYAALAKKALQAGSEEDARVFITKKQQRLPADKIKVEDIPNEIEKLKALMKVASNQLDFEKAIEIRDTINLLKRRLLKR